MADPGTSAERAWENRPSAKLTVAALGQVENPEQIDAGYDDYGYAEDGSDLAEGQDPRE